MGSGGCTNGCAAPHGSDKLVHYCVCSTPMPQRRGKEHESSESGDGAKLAQSTD